MSEVT